MIQWSIEPAIQITKDVTIQRSTDQPSNDIQQFSDLAIRTIQRGTGNPTIYLSSDPNDPTI